MITCHCQQVLRLGGFAVEGVDCHISKLFTACALQHFVEYRALLEVARQ